MFYYTYKYYFFILGPLISIKIIFQQKTAVFLEGLEGLLYLYKIEKELRPYHEENSNIK